MIYRSVVVLPCLAISDLLTHYTRPQKGATVSRVLSHRTVSKVLPIKHARRELPRGARAARQLGPFDPSCSVPRPELSAPYFSPGALESRGRAAFPGSIIRHDPRRGAPAWRPGPRFGGGIRTAWFVFQQKAIPIGSSLHCTPNHHEKCCLHLTPNYYKYTQLFTHQPADWPTWHSHEPGPSLFARPPRAVLELAALGAPALLLVGREGDQTPGAADDCRVAAVFVLKHDLCQ